MDNDEGLVIEQSLCFGFPTFNNQAEYEVCLAELSTAYDLRAEVVTLYSDSQLLVNPVNEEYQVKELALQCYLEKVKAHCSKFKQVQFKQISRAENSRTDVLARLASTKAWETTARSFKLPSILLASTWSC